MNKTRLASMIAMAVMVAGTASPALAERPASAGHEEKASKSRGFSEQAKERMSAHRKNLVTKWWGRAQKRLQKLIDREKKIATRIQERITKLAADGRDVTTLNSDMAKANAKVTDAQTALASASAQVDSILANNTPKDAFSKLHELYKGVIEKIKVAHRALIKVLAETRGLSESPKPSASPSTSVSPSPSPSPSPTPTTS